MTIFNTPNSVFEYLSNKGIDFKCINTSYVSYINNSEVCPKNGVINKKRDDKLPMKYLGIRGLLKFNAEESKLNLFKESLVHLTVGGKAGYIEKYNIYEYRFSFCMFLDDFPLIHKTYEERQILNILSNSVSLVKVEDLNKQ